eukprot:CAMPEP_0115042834 /NCGR_PEP_ID=MMETSP0216-20121206/46502_1 /TAXON_ID=223996 /ORGANISM="Protocruzia adherens, Strain Boccale" /LENGTH=123 /DNA_ID=CAMNT_0002425025 /DNA_START=118 /DNA_END=485 /DNA_ORIENTATION=-
MTEFKAVEVVDNVFERGGDGDKWWGMLWIAGVLSVEEDERTEMVYQGNEFRDIDVLGVLVVLRKFIAGQVFGAMTIENCGGDLGLVALYGVGHQAIVDSLRVDNCRDKVLWVGTYSSYPVSIV